MSRARYAPEFKAEAVKQMTERGHGVFEVATVSQLLQPLRDTVAALGGRQ